MESRTSIGPSPRARVLRGALIAGLVASFAAIEAMAPAPSAAGTVTVPMRLDHEFLRRLVVAQAFTAPGEEAELWSDARGCGHLTLREPKVDSVVGRLRVRARGDARWGTPVGDTCVLPLSWNGTVEVFLEPSLDPKLPIVHFRAVDSNVYGKDGRKTRITSRLWDWIKNYAHERMETVKVDLHRPLEEVRGLLPLVLPAAYRDDADVTLGSATLAQARVEDRGLVIELSLAAPDPPPGTPLGEPPLDVKEIEQWDAFLTFVIKHAALEVEDPAVRDALLGVLLDSRYDIVEALISAEPGDPDPVPDLFRKAWERLGPALRRVDDSLPGAAALRYLAFIAAGDALLAIEKLGPQTGLEISADGLRRLARILAPDATADPLQYETAVDPELRARLGFGPPLPLPASPPPPELLAPGAPPSTLDAPSKPASTTTTTLVVPRATTTTTSTTLPSPRAADSPLSRLLEWLLPSAHAGDNPIEELRARMRKGWVPQRSELDAYLAFVEQMLREAAEQTLAKKPVPAPFTPVFRPLALATAWKESCWRQFVRRGGKIVVIESRAGAIGIMQINPRVWRGFYQVTALRADADYNARAGSEILQHYLVDYAIRKKEHEKGGSMDALARATYAAYNGGPGHLSRYRSPKTPKSLRSIDAEFWKIYQAAKKGEAFDRKKCYGS